MKGIFILSTLASALVFSSLAMAEDHPGLSVGYAQSEAKGLTVRGVNVKYRYEWEKYDPVSFLLSFTYLNGDKTYHGGAGYYSTKDDVKYYSLSTGPVYRFNQYISAYALLGINHTKVEEHFRNIVGVSERDTWRSTTVAYGAGIQINPIENLIFDIGYEGSSPSINGNRVSFNGFNVGVGYRF